MKKHRFFRWIGLTSLVCALVAVSLYFLIDWTALTSQFVVKGVVIDQDGKPVSGARLTFHASQSNFFANTYDTKDVVVYSRSNGTFRVGSPYRLLQFWGFEREGYLGELDDERLSHAFDRSTTGVAVHAYSESGSANLSGPSTVHKYSMPADGAVLLDMAAGKTTDDEKMADLIVTSRVVSSSRGPIPIEIEIRAVEGGVRLTSSERPYAPAGDYIEGFTVSWVNYPAVNYQPQYISGFFESHNRQRIGHFDLELGVPDRATGAWKLQVQSMVNLDGGRFVGWHDVPRKREFDELNCAKRWVLTERPWWFSPGGVHVIVSKDDALTRLASNTTNPFEKRFLEHALLGAQTDEAVYIAVVDACWSDRDINTLRAMAANPTAFPSVLRKLSTHPNPEIRREIAVRKDCPQDIMDLLSQDLDASVREGSKRTQRN